MKVIKETPSLSNTGRECRSTNLLNVCGLVFCSEDSHYEFSQPRFGFAGDSNDLVNIGWFEGIGEAHVGDY